MAQSRRLGMAPENTRVLRSDDWDSRIPCKPRLPGSLRLGAGRASWIARTLSTTVACRGSVGGRTSHEPSERYRVARAGGGDMRHLVVSTLSLIHISEPTRQ